MVGAPLCGGRRLVSAHFFSVPGLYSMSAQVSRIFLR